MYCVLLFRSGRYESAIGFSDPRNRTVTVFDAFRDDLSIFLQPSDTEEGEAVHTGEDPPIPDAQRAKLPTGGVDRARGAQLELLGDDVARPSDHVDRSGPVEVDPAAVPVPLHATRSAGEGA